MSKEQYSELGTWLESLDKEDPRGLIRALRASMVVFHHTRTLKDLGLSGGQFADQAASMVRLLTTEAKRVYAEEITETFARTPAHCRVSYWIGDEP